MLIETKNNPIIKPATRAGASFVIALNPTGLRHISPTVCRKYVPVSHHGETSAPAIAALAGGIRIANAIAPNKQTPGKFGRAGRLPFAQRDPQPRKRRRQNHYKKRRHELEPARRKIESQQHVARAPLREKIQRRTALLVGRPEHRRRHKQHQNRTGALALDRRTIRARAAATRKSPPTPESEQCRAPPRFAPR